MTDDKFFDLLLTGLRTRESSTLVIATVATSASLVLLAIPTQSIDEGLRSILPWIGIVSPLLGFGYREITILTIDQDDWLKIRSRMSYVDNQMAKRTAHIEKYGRVRGMIFRTFLLVPTIVWSIVLVKYSLMFVIIIPVFLVYWAVVLSLVEWEIRKRHEQNTSDKLLSDTVQGRSPSVKYIRFLVQILGILVGSVLQLFASGLFKLGFSIESLSLWITYSAIGLGVILASLALALGRPPQKVLWYHFLVGIPQGVFITALVSSETIQEYESQIF